MFNSFLSRFVLVALGALVGNMSMATMSPAETTPIRSDGFIVVSIASPELEMKVCTGQRRWRSKGGFFVSSPACFEEFRSGSVKGVGVSAVSPQQALDVAFGERKALVVGLAFARLEKNREGVVIYYNVVR